MATFLGVYRFSLPQRYRGVGKVFGSREQGGREQGAKGEGAGSKGGGSREQGGREQNLESDNVFKNFMTMAYPLGITHIPHHVETYVTPPPPPWIIGSDEIP